MRWLLKTGAGPSTSIVNKNGLTPLTLAVRSGSIQVLRALTNEAIIKNNIWKFGDAELNSLDLEQYDTSDISKRSDLPDYLLRLSLKRGHLKSSPEEKGLHHEQRDLTREQAMENAFYRSSLVAGERLSALEIVVRHEVGSLLCCFHLRENAVHDEDWVEEDKRLFQNLILDKWNKFGRKHHILYAMLPHFLVLVLYVCAMVVRMTWIYERRIGTDFPGTMGFWEIETALQNKKRDPFL